MSPGAIDRVVVSLLDKYRCMRDMRLADLQPSPPDPRAQMRALAARFPGALREIDQLPLAEIEARIASLEAVASQRQPVATWMLWMSDYHAFLRAALRQRRAGTSTAEAARELTGEVTIEGGDTEEASLADSWRDAVRRPTGGRLNQVAFEWVAERHATHPETVRITLFPSRLARP